MPTFKPYTLPALARTLAQLEAACYTPLRTLDIAAWWSRELLPFAERMRGEPRQPALGEAWGSLFDCAWFLFSGAVPAEAAGQHVVLLLDVNGELCVVDEAGEPLRGLTNRASEFDYRLGRPGKRVLEISARAAGGEPIAVWADAACNDLFGRVQEGGVIQLAHIATCDDTVLALFYDFEVLLDFLKCLPANTPRAQQILSGLTDAAQLIGGGIAANAAAARERLAPLLAQRGGDPSLTISAIGHAHMDLAWLWPIRETIRKGARTFSTALANIERYPDYVFGASQPQYFQWMREHYPALYERIRAQVRAGRIEPQGAMWVEADTNIAGGEALARQLLLGMRFFEQEFGVRCTYLWLPDVFGYSAALPQLLRLAGLRYFSTQKLSWSEINVFPHHSFHWQGIDGSRILAHMLPEETYNGPALPRSVVKIEQNYKDSGVSGHSLMVFGIGDGGGGPGEEHLERLARIRNLAGLSPVQQRSVADFFEDWQADADHFATWVGELYLERHQGTYTTQARNKRANRQSELALRALEIAALSDVLWAGGSYPAESLELIWREVLLYQFHDILPGSSIKRVYDESLPRYEAMLAELRERTGAHLAHLAAQADTRGMSAPLLVWNPLSWARSEWIKNDTSWLYVTVPPLGYAVVDAAAQPERGALGELIATPELLENDLLRVQFGSDGAITSVYDKRAAREVLARTQDGRQEETAATTAKAIVALAPHVDAAERGRLLELARGLSGTRYDDSWGRSAEEVQERALTGLIPSLEGAARDQAYAEAKRRALALPDTHYTEMPRFTALLRLLPHADAADRHAFAEQILSDFAGEKRWPRPDDVIATAPFLDSAQRARLLAAAPDLTRNWYDAPRAELAAALGVNHINNSAPESEKAG